MEVSSQPHAPAALPQGKSPWHPLDRTLDGPQSLSEQGGEEKNFTQFRDSKPREIRKNYTLLFIVEMLFSVDCFEVMKYEYIQ
jgi:hypothetical protein